MFKLTDKQLEAQKYFASDSTHICLSGGSRSGKTSLIVRNIILRALKAKNSRHVIFRHRFNAVKSSIMQDTFPKIMRIAFEGVDYTINKADGFATFENGSEIWFCGLDEAERVEKILGMEFCTIYLNECSQIKYESYLVVVTRLAQKVIQEIEGSALNNTTLPRRFYYDLNPSKKRHWIYKLFIKHTDINDKPLPNPDNYCYFQINPSDNIENLDQEYIDSLQALPESYRKRFLYGEFTDDRDNALFSDDIIDEYRHSGALPQLLRVVVSVDPSGASDDNDDADAIGIVVAGLGIDGNAYVLEDCTVCASPKVWGKVATDAFDRHKADVIVGEINYGGAMVNFVIQSSRKRTPFKMVTATRGKHVRAMPISALYEQGKVRHVGYFNDMENELLDFTSVGYVGTRSPNRADALIWALTELFPGIVEGKKEIYELDYSELDAMII